MKLKMGDFVGDREPLPIRVMQGIDSDDWNAVLYVDEAGELIVQGGEPHARSERLRNFVNGNGNYADTETCEELLSHG
jgi:hypothetical protein